MAERHGPTWIGGCALAPLVLANIILIFGAIQGCTARLDRIEQNLELSSPREPPAPFWPWRWADWRRQLFERDGLDPEK